MIDGMTEPSPYYMTLSLNVLNHLGLNLYSNVPAVLSEVVANAWDADADIVHVTIDHDAARITVLDNGTGMTIDDMNNRYLYVGYERRKSDETRYSAKFKRPVMGRKGIGKLSLLSIARNIEVHTAKDGQKHAMRMKLEDIEHAISSSAQGVTYRPGPVDSSVVDFDHGTRIVLTDLKKELINIESGLRKRLARRFSILGQMHNFQLFVNGEEVGVADREYFHLIQYLWSYEEKPPEQEGEGSDVKDSEPKTIFERCTKATKRVYQGIQNVDNSAVTGWIGTVFKSGNLKDTETGDNLNKIVLMVRGKLAHEDLLEEFTEAGVFRSYVIGEITADFLDLDNEPDIATSSRQRIIEDDPRYKALLKWLNTELAKIKNLWTDYRNEEGKDTALTNPLIKEWFQSLGKDNQKKAERLFGKINQITTDDDSQKSRLFINSVLAFESYRYQENLDALDQLTPEQIPALEALFRDAAEIEAAMYHQIVTQRLTVIKKLEEDLDGDARERVLQEQLFEHLWLLDASWERATDATMEEGVGKAFEKINAKLTEEERKSRIDIRYKRPLGAHVIVELKRPSVITNTSKLLEQVDKYRNALRQYLLDIGRTERVEVVCVVGRDLKDWQQLNGRDESRETLDPKHIRVVKYDELLENAKASYGEYLAKEKSLGRIRKLLDGLAETGDGGQGSSSA